VTGAAAQLVVEADGGSRGNPGPAGYGAVVRDADGQVLAETAEFIGTASNNVAEYRGLIAGLRAAHRLAPDARVRVRMDSKLVVEQMSGRWKIKHPDIRPLAAEAGAVHPPDAVSYEWIPRAENGHADRLANEAMDAGKRGERWQQSASTAELRAAAAAVGPAEAGDAAPAPSSAVVGWGADRGAPTVLVLLRHGETPLTPQKRFSGTGADPELSPTGLRQAEAAATALAARGTVQAVLSSPLRRCRQTAAAAGAALGLPVEIEEGLREAEFGVWEGLTFAEVQQRYPEDLHAWLTTPKAEPTGGGESFASVARRSAATRDRILARHPGRTVLLVSHVTPIKSLIRLAVGAPPEAMFRMELAAASLSVIAHYTTGDPSLRLFNDTGHLR
jgi:probable phosphoglycerate mutase